MPILKAPTVVDHSELDTRLSRETSATAVSFSTQLIKKREKRLAKASSLYCVEILALG
jgi:hypothetical protein